MKVDQIDQTFCKKAGVCFYNFIIRTKFKISDLHHQMFPGCGNMFRHATVVF